MIYSDMKVEKQPDGRFKATAVGVPPTIGRDEQEAIELSKRALQEAHSLGKLGTE